MINRRLILFAISIFLFLALVYFFWDYSIDDAFITFKYAKNLADGHGLVFNPDDSPVEGYSNFLWLLLLALVYKIGLPTYLASKQIGVICFLLTGVLWYRFFAKDISRPLWLVGPLFLICPITAFWAVSGLELGLHALLVSVAIILLLRNSKVAFVILPLLIISRPEGFAIAFTLVLASLIYDYDIKGKKLDIKYHLNLLITLVIVTIGLFLFRYYYFGYIFPNTYYAKTFYEHLNGYKELWRMLLIFAPLTLAYLFWFGRLVYKRSCPKIELLAGLVIIFQVFISASVDPIMNFQFRYLISFLPMLLIIAISVAGQVKNNLISKAIIAVFAVSLFLPVNGLIDKLKSEREIIKAQFNLIKYINTLPDRTTIALTDIGRVPYYTHTIYHDLWGLIDEKTAHYGFDPGRELLRRPDYFILVGYIINDQVNLRFERERFIAKQAPFPENYQLLNIFLSENKKPTDPGYYYLLFRRKTG